jgi:ribosomal protein S18 acetylase RimI-like enzyme
MTRFSTTGPARAPASGPARRGERLAGELLDPRALAIGQIRRAALRLLHEVEQALSLVRGERPRGRRAADVDLLRDEQDLLPGDSLRGRDDRAGSRHRVLRLPRPRRREPACYHRTIEARIDTRPATADDLDDILATLFAGFESFAEFAPAGWTPPEPQRERTLRRLVEPTTWALIAHEGDRAVGHVSFTPARGHPFEQPDGTWLDEPPIPGEAHLWQLFVVPDRWGAGIASALHDLAIVAMRAREYERARLFTPVANARARGFYERRGWTRAGGGFDSDMGLELLEYRIELG